MFVFKYRRKVARDHTIVLHGQVLALPLLDRRLRRERELAATLAPLDAVQLRAADGLRPEPGLVPEPATLVWAPPAEHPWRRVRRDTALYQTRLTVRRLDSASAELRRFGSGDGWLPLNHGSATFAKLSAVHAEYTEEDTQT